VELTKPDQSSGTQGMKPSKSDRKKGNKPDIFEDGNIEL